LYSGIFGTDEVRQADILGSEVSDTNFGRNCSVVRCDVAQLFSYGRPDFRM